MTRIEMGTIVDGYEAAMITEGFDIKFEVTETDSGVKNTFDTLGEFAEEVILTQNMMGYYRLKTLLEDLIAKVIDSGAYDVINKWKVDQFVSEDELETLGVDE